MQLLAGDLWRRPSSCRQDFLALAHLANKTGSNRRIVSIQLRSCVSFLEPLWFNRVHDQGPLSGLTANWQSRPQAVFAQPVKQSLNVEREWTAAAHPEVKIGDHAGSRCGSIRRPPYVAACSFNTSMLFAMNVSPGSCSKLLTSTPIPPHCREEISLTTIPERHPSNPSSTLSLRGCANLRCRVHPEPEAIISMKLSSQELTEMWYRNSVSLRFEKPPNKTGSSMSHHPCHITSARIGRRRRTTSRRMAMV